MKLVTRQAVRNLSGAWMVLSALATPLVLYAMLERRGIGIKSAPTPLAWLSLPVLWAALHVAATAVFARASRRPTPDHGFETFMMAPVSFVALMITTNIAFARLASFLETGHALAPWLAFLVSAVAFVPLALFVVKRIYALVGLPPGGCPECGYDLQGLAGGGCPECGWGRDADR